MIVVLRLFEELYRVCYIKDGTPNEQENSRKTDP